MQAHSYGDLLEALADLPLLTEPVDETAAEDLLRVAEDDGAGGKRHGCDSLARGCLLSRIPGHSLDYQDIPCQGAPAVHSITTVDGEPDVSEMVEEARRRYDNTRRAVSGLIAYLGMPQAALARAMGMSRQTLSSRLSGTSEIKGWERDGLAALLGVPVEVLGLDPDDALRWVLDHPDRRPEWWLRTGTLRHVVERQLAGYPLIGARAA